MFHLRDTLPHTKRDFLMELCESHRGFLHLYVEHIKLIKYGGVCVSRLLMPEYLLYYARVCFMCRRQRGTVMAYEHSRLFRGKLAKTKGHFIAVFTWKSL